MHEFEKQSEKADLQNSQPEMEIPDVHRKKDIVQIQNPILREKEIKPAKKIGKENEMAKKNQNV